MVLATLLYEPDALKNIRDIVDSSLLDSQFFYCYVEIEGLIGSPLKEFDESQCQSDEPIFLPSPTTWLFEVFVWVTVVADIRVLIDRAAALAAAGHARLLVIFQFIRGIKGIIVHNWQLLFLHNPLVRGASWSLCERDGAGALTWVCQTGRGGLVFIRRPALRTAFAFHDVLKLLN